jgi:hypothetical protein
VTDTRVLTPSAGGALSPPPPTPARRAAEPGPLAAPPAPAAMEVAAGTWCNKCMGPARLGEQRLLLTSCSHIICDACVRSMDHSENICAACKSECQAVVVTSENFGEQSPEIQDVLAPRASETILDQAIQRVARIEHFKRQQFRDQIIVQQQKHTDHGKHLQTLSRDNQQLQQENKKLRQENKRLQRGHAVPGTSSSSRCVRARAASLPRQRALPADQLRAVVCVGAVPAVHAR